MGHEPKLQKPHAELFPWHGGARPFSFSALSGRQRTARSPCRPVPRPKSRTARTPQFVKFAGNMPGALLRRASRDAQGTRWRTAEHRIKPELITVQTGYMQGASGIGMWLLHLDAFEHQKDRQIRFPDSPF